MARPSRFFAIVAELNRLEAAREAAMLDAFAALEAQDPELAAMALQHSGERRRAARWMSMPQRVFSGRSAYQVLADGDIERVWDHLLDSEGSHATLRPADARMAY
ncbi:antitoxin Xre/MbcA/ParS toxin-binding domain-containing protein [Dyella ginsengisoli]|uniref:antitoxin Xre/MbcA/ParS toxin-binding domain-containing protein n=1 Tax=Dyella ginsengisoli TaxID=363848 RepID=UPI00034C82BE|nr:antitoxin Xre/MbcA/ParS toxin-binding domain-containing protein [Dyella ginsengisoli]